VIGREVWVNLLQKNKNGDSGQVGFLVVIFVREGRCCDRTPRQNRALNDRDL
jgi:hypothetical protein